MKTAPIGIDVSSKMLDVKADFGRKILTAQFENKPSGHATLIRWLKKRKATARIVLEATGVYSFELALALHNAKRVQVMVINPRAAHHFAKATMARGKSDDIDAGVLMEFARRMDFQPWSPPSQAQLQFRTLVRRIKDLTKQLTIEKNRLHAANAAPTLSSLVLEDLQESIAFLKRRRSRLESEAVLVLKTDEVLREKYELLQTIPGFGATSSLSLLSELVSIEGELSVRQLVAYAGLDPIPDSSGSRGKYADGSSRMRLSKRGNARLRGALYFPAMVAATRDSVVKAYYERVQSRGSKKIPALCAVMRKLLHAIVGMFKTRTAFDAHLCFNTPPQTKKAA